jgi:hypothetical protein
MRLGFEFRPATGRFSTVINFHNSMLIAVNFLFRLPTLRDIRTMQRLPCLGRKMIQVYSLQAIPWYEQKFASIIVTWGDCAFKYRLYPKLTQAGSVSRRHLTAEARIQFRGSSWKICGGQREPITAVGFPQSISVFSSHHYAIVRKIVGSSPEEFDF